MTLNNRSLEAKTFLIIPTESWRGAKIATDSGRTGKTTSRDAFSTMPPFSVRFSRVPSPGTVNEKFRRWKMQTASSTRCVVPSFCPGNICRSFFWHGSYRIGVRWESEELLSWKDASYPFASVYDLSTRPWTCSECLLLDISAKISRLHVRAGQEREMGCHRRIVIHDRVARSITILVNFAIVSLELGIYLGR